jgi:hypothetical protein
VAATHANPADPPRTFHAPRSIRAVSGAAALVFLVVSILSWSASGWSWTTIVALCLVPFAFAGLADTLTSRIELHADSLVVVQNLRRREYPRSTFVDVAWGKGGPVALKRSSGEWLRLPGVGTSNQGLANTLRAWIRNRQPRTGSTGRSS